MAKRISEVPAPVVITPDAIRRLVQTINKQLAGLQRQIDDLRAARGD